MLKHSECEPYTKLSVLSPYPLRITTFLQEVPIAEVYGLNCGSKQKELFFSPPEDKIPWPDPGVCDLSSLLHIWWPFEQVVPNSEHNHSNIILGSSFVRMCGYS